MPDYPEEFEAAYIAYPRHTGKGAALKAYLRARKTASAEEILRGVVGYAEAQRRDPRYRHTKRWVAHMATWLRAGRWLDDTADLGVEPDDGQPQANGHSARFILERQIFLGSPRRARWFMEYVLVPARDLHLAGADDDGVLAGALGLLTLKVAAARRNAGLPQELIDRFGGDATLVRWYVDWLAAQQWLPNASTQTLRFESLAFNRFRRQQALADGQGRDPITGRSIYG